MHTLHSAPLIQPISSLCPCVPMVSYVLLFVCVCVCVCVCVWLYLYLVLSVYECV